MFRINACCFSGHRPEKLPLGGDEKSIEVNKIKENLRYQISQAICNDYTKFYCPMAKGFDIFAAEELLQYKTLLNSVQNNLPEINLICVLSCETQANTWDEFWRDRYFDILMHCDKVITLSTHYHKNCMRKCNQYLIQHSNLLITYFDGKMGGTRFSVDYARRKGINIINLYEDAYNNEFIYQDNVITKSNNLLNNII